ncbi:hypothetical protein AAE02nite_24800 [Adhaeribacter aerolatus]|uniref:Uncharacterized protein n=1 Tax=Adhaeribacter aerolatus TaxID=670289 RepID=A0A512AYP3_9BACT|nr:hypothetical protein [Adhaeribacter aerolatus]GEO04816.1 hypothetical protein AAE02nite_24800 [Adhaeribacter aerolatus]
MVIDYLCKVEAMDIGSLKKQERESLVTILSYLGRRERNPWLVQQIRRNINRLRDDKPY